MEHDESHSPRKACPTGGCHDRPSRWALSRRQIRDAGVTCEIRGETAKRKLTPTMRRGATSREARVVEAAKADPCVACRLCETNCPDIALFIES